MPNTTAATTAKPPNMLPRIVVISAAVLKELDSGKAFVDVSDVKTLDKEVDDENEIVDVMKLDKGGANNAVAKPDVDAGD